MFHECMPFLAVETWRACRKHFNDNGDFMSKDRGSRTEPGACFIKTTLKIALGYLG